jgi:hypothetical protein
MTSPSFVNAGTYATATATSITPALPGSRTTGNLLVAFAHFAGSASPITWSVSSGWTIFASLGQGGSRPMVLAYCYVTGAEAAPVFTQSGTANTVSGQVLQYTGAVASSPIGNVSSNSGVSGPITCPAIISTAANSLAVNALVTTTQPGAPSGWSLETTTSSASGDPTISDLTVASAGSSSGATSVAASVSNYDNFIFEIRSQAPPAAVRPRMMTLLGCG